MKKREDEGNGMKRKKKRKALIKKEGRCKGMDRRRER